MRTVDITIPNILNGAFLSVVGFMNSIPVVVTVCVGLSIIVLNTYKALEIKNRVREKRKREKESGKD